MLGTRKKTGGPTRAEASCRGAGEGRSDHTHPSRARARDDMLPACELDPNRQLCPGPGPAIVSGLHSHYPADRGNPLLSERCFACLLGSLRAFVVPEPAALLGQALRRNRDRAPRPQPPRIDPVRPPNPPDRLSHVLTRIALLPGDGPQALPILHLNHQGSPRSLRLPSLAPRQRGERRHPPHHTAEQDPSAPSRASRHLGLQYKHQFDSRIYHTSVRCQ